MTHLKDLILDRLVAASSRCAVLERDIKAAERRADEACSVAAKLTEKNNGLVREAASARTALQAIERETNASARDRASKLGALYESADAMLGATAAQRNPKLVEDARKKLRSALKAAFDYCGQIPF